MTVVESLLLGVVEGITEFLPVSSTGHLILTEKLLGLKANPSFDVIIQLGAILAVVFHFRQKIITLTQSAIKDGIFKINPLTVVILSTFPALLLGGIFASKIKKYLFNDLTVSVMLILVGIVIIIIEKRNGVFREGTSLSPTRINAGEGTSPSPNVGEALVASRDENLESVSLKKGIIIGFYQCLAMIPGTSRSAATIFGGMLSGLSRKAAVEFSFFLAIPTMCAATAHEIPEVMKGSIELIPLVTGFAVSFVVALLVIKWFIKYISGNSFVPFGIYRIALGILVLIIRFL